MKKLLFLFPILFLTILLTSCSAASKFIPDNLYSEEKIERTKESFSGKYGELLDSYTVAGDTYSLYCSRQDENNTYTVTKCMLNSDNEQLLPLALEESVNYLFICADAKGDILLSDTTTVYVFQSGETLSSLSIPTWSAGGMLITSDNLLVCQTFNNSAYFLFNLSTGDKQGTFWIRIFCLNREHANLFYAKQTGNSFYLPVQVFMNILKIPGSFVFLPLEPVCLSLSFWQIILKRVSITHGLSVIPIINIFIHQKKPLMKNRLLFVSLPGRTGIH